MVYSSHVPYYTSLHKVEGYQDHNLTTKTDPQTEQNLT